jgi:hypothetical protein
MPLAEIFRFSSGKCETSISRPYCTTTTGYYNLNYVSVGHTTYVRPLIGRRRWAAHVSSFTPRLFADDLSAYDEGHHVGRLEGHATCTHAMEPTAVSAFFAQANSDGQPLTPVEARAARDAARQAALAM